MEKKDVLKVSVFTGLGLWCVPIFVKSLSWLRWLSYPVMGFGVIYLIAGDQLSNMFSGFSGSKTTSKERLLAEKEKYELERWRLQQKIEKEKLNVELEKQKAETRKVQQLGKATGSGEGKLPDVLGNIGGLFGGQESKEESGDKPKKKKDNTEDLMDLF